MSYPVYNYRSARRSEVQVVLRTNGVGFDALKALLKNINELGAPGHSFGICSDDSPPVKLGGWDGDGGAFIEIVSHEDVETE